MNKPIAIGLVVLSLGVIIWTEYDVAQKTEPNVGVVENNPCDDGDPCTVDRWLRFERKCVHAPDALCTGKSCTTNEDCTFAEGLAPCMSSVCHEGECRYMKIARDECIRCDAETPCEGSFCDPRACIDGYCRHAPRNCDDANPNTRDRCDESEAACKHDLADDTIRCVSDSECTTDHPCQTLRCVSGRCLVTAATKHCDTPILLPKRCNRNTDCIHVEDDVCYAGPCIDGFCEMRRVEHSQCQPCTGDHDCKGTFCQWPICTGTVCVVEEVPFCQDDNPHTVDSCSEERMGCLHRWTTTPSECRRENEDDGDPATVDACHTETGVTVHLPKGPDGPCATSNRCWTTYSDSDGRCLATPLHCHHDDACPAECNPDRGCILDPNRDCHCETHDDCDLGTPCARVFCLQEDGGACWGTFIDGCVPCTSDSDCRVDNWCVFGACQDGYCYYEDGKTCDDGDPETFGFCHGQRDDPCTYERIYDYD
ncbi:MAG: hypothetical protein VX223_13920 [Myxococcota bacterium]|nr:hypothetical protein [Myxococcota bacterium]